MKTTTETLNVQQAMVLMEIEERIEEDAVGLSRSLNMTTARFIQVATDLQHRGLIRIKRVSGELYVSLSKRGKRMMGSLWPEGMYAHLS